MKKTEIGKVGMVTSYSNKKGFTRLSVLVQGRKRKVRVIFHGGILRGMSKELAARAASLADRRGWKQVVITVDDVYGEYLEILNLDQQRTNYDKGKSGIVLGWLGSPGGFHVCVGDIWATTPLEYAEGVL